MTESVSHDPLDFNDCHPPAEHDHAAWREDIRAALLARLESVLFTLFPAGKVRRGRFTIGDVLGSPGESLEIVLSGDKAGLWTDRESGEGGDVFDVVARNQRIDARADFQRLLTYCSELVGRADRTPTRSASRDVLRPSTSWVLPRRNGTIWTPTVS